MNEEALRYQLFEEWKVLDAAAQKKLRELVELDRKIRQAQVNPPEPVMQTESR